MVIFENQVELSQEMINLKQAEAEKRRSAVKKNKTWNYCHNAVFSMYFLSHNFPFFRPRSHNPIIPHFFQFMTQRAKSARASSAARMRSTPSASRVYTVIVLSLTSLTLTSFSSFHLFFFLCLTTPQCWSNVSKQHPWIRSCFFVWPLPLARECTRCRKTKFTFHIQTVTFHKHWTFVRATARGQILDIHSLRRLATRTNEQGLVLYIITYFINRCSTKLTFNINERKWKCDAGKIKTWLHWILFTYYLL